MAAHLSQSRLTISVDGGVSIGFLSYCLICILFLKLYKIKALPLVTIIDGKSQTPTKKRKWYSHEFRKEWLTNPEFNQWLKQNKNDSNFSYCKCCNITLKNANKTLLVNHTNTGKHKSLFNTSESI